MVSIDGETWLMGVIGDPIAQIRTPQAINPIFAARVANVVCLPLHVPAERLDEAWAGLRATRNLVGFGVTLPHKQAAFALCDSLDPLAERVGAVNLVRRERDGSLRGYQFDGGGFVRGLQAQGVDPRGRSVLMAGAGGAAMAIGFALHEAGVDKIVVANRTREKAEALALALNAAAGRDLASTGEPLPRPGQLVINATSLGLRPEDPLPLDPAGIGAGTIVAEVIARPETTRLLEVAQARGARTHSGIHMITGQVGLIADHILELWG